MKTRILVAVVGVPILLAVIFALPDWCFGLLVTVMAAIGSGELLHAVQPRLPQGLYVYVGVIAALTAASMIFGAGETAAAAAAFFRLVLNTLP